MLHQIWHCHQILQKFQILYPENASVITVSNGISCYWIPLFSLNQLLQQLPILITASALSVATQLTKRTCPTTKQNPITRSPRKLCSCLLPRIPTLGSESQAPPIYSLASFGAKTNAQSALLNWNSTLSPSRNLRACINRIWSKIYLLITYSCCSLST